MNFRKNVQRLSIYLALFVFTRGALHLIPGDPVELLLAEGGLSMSREALRSELGLNRPFGASVIQDVPRFLSGDWGHSLISQEPVTHLIATRWQSTANVAVLSLLIALPLSILLGVTAGTRRFFPRRASSAAQTFGSSLAALSSALPLPWLGVLLSFCFCIWLPWFELTGSRPLAAITLSIPLVGTWSRIISYRTDESLRAPAALAARARGLPEQRIAWGYGFLPSAGSLAAYLCSHLGGLLAGTYVIETLFDVAGLGTLFIDAVLRRDYPVVEGCVWFTAALSLLGTALGDWLQLRLDPRLENLASRGAQ